MNWIVRNRKQTPLATLLDEVEGHAAWRRARLAEGAAMLRQKKVEKRQRQAAARRAARKQRRKALRPKQRYARPGREVLAAAMDQGVWYDRRQICALLPGDKPKTVGRWLHGALDCGLIERGFNANFDESKPAGNQSVSRYVYRLSSEGVRIAQSARAALAGGWNTGGKGNGA